MAQRPIFLRTICLVMAVGLLLTAGWFALETRRALADYARLRDARPLTMTANLAQPGTYRARRRTTLRRPHVHRLYVEKSIGDDAAREPTLAGLEGRIVVLNGAGEEVYRGDLPQAVPPDRPPDDDDARWLADLPPLDADEYTLELRVNEPAAAMPDAPVKLHTRYELSRADLVPTRLSLLVAAVCGAAGLMLAVVATVAFRPRGDEG